MVSEMNLQPPTSFSFSKSEEWPKWKRRFEQYRQASGLVDKDELRQVSTLLYCLGGEAEVLDTTRISAEDRNKYKNVVEELVRDRLVVGIRDLALSERLQLESDLTLDKAKRLIRQREAVKLQQDFLQKPKMKEEIPLDAIRQKPTKRKLPALPLTPARPSVSNCRRCGSGSHPRQSCPARDATCFRCNRRGHFSSQCLSNTVAMITIQPEQPIAS